MTVNDSISQLCMLAKCCMASDNLEFSDSDFGIALSIQRWDDKTTIHDWMSACSDKTNEFLHLISICRRAINIIHTPLKSTFSGLQLCRRHYGSIFIRSAVVASQSREITRNSDKIWPYSSSRSSKVINLGVNRKPMYDFVLVTNSNFGRICYRFRDIGA